MKEDLRTEIKELLEKLRKDFGIRMHMREDMKYATKNVSLLDYSYRPFHVNLSLIKAFYILEEIYNKNKKMPLNIRKISKSQYEKEFGFNKPITEPEQIVLI